MSESAETINKEELNPLFRGRFKPRSVDSTKQTHLPRLQHKSAKYRYVLLGDSMIERYLTTGAGKIDPGDRRRNNDEAVEGNVEPVDMWQKYHNMKAINLGVGGDGVSEVMHRVFGMNSIYSWPENPEKIVIWIGANDIERYTEEIVFDGIVNLVNKIQDCYKKELKYTAEVGIVSVLPRFTRSTKISVSDLNRSIQRLNYQLAKFAQERDDVDFLDIYFDFYENYKIMNEFFDGPVHLNNAGYQRMDDKFNSFLTTRKTPPVTNKPKKQTTSIRDESNDVSHTKETKPMTAAMKKNMKRKNKKKTKVVESDIQNDESDVIVIDDEPEHVHSEHDESHEVEVNYEAEVEDINEIEVNDDDNGWDTVTRPTKKYTKKTIEELKDIDSSFD